MLFSHATREGGWPTIPLETRRICRDNVPPGCFDSIFFLDSDTEDLSVSVTIQLRFQNYSKSYDCEYSYDCKSKITVMIVNTALILRAMHSDFILKKNSLSKHILKLKSCRYF